MLIMDQEVLGFSDAGSPDPASFSTLRMSSAALNALHYESAAGPLPVGLAPGCNNTFCP